ncbi:MAG: thioredoxin [Nitriliruptoraceae bacterium]
MELGFGQRWLDRRLRVALLVVVTLGTVLAPLLGSAPALAQDAATSPVEQLPDDLRGAVTEDGRVELLFFGSLTCPYCQEMELYLDDLEERYAPPLDVVRHEVSQDTAARDRWAEELLSRGQEPSGVPTTLVGDRIWIGYSEEIGREITQVVDALTTVVAAEQELDDDPDAALGPGADLDGDEVDTSVEVPLVGEVELTGRSALGVTALIAFVDGFNPCSLWVLAILLAMVLNAGATRGRVLAVGLTFLTVTTAIYGLFIVGVFTVVDLLSSVTAITWIVGAVALFVGLVNIKDYFAYKQGLSFTIPDRFKPRLYRGGRAVRDHERPLLPILGTTVVLAAGASIIELPCTMGFPVVWTGTLQSLGIERGAEFAGLLGLYLLIYVLDELLLFGVVVVTMEVTRVEEKHGRALKLVGGSLMVVLGLAMVFTPTLLEDLTGLLALTLASVLLVLLLALVQRARSGGAAPEPERTPARSGSATSGRQDRSGVGRGSDGADRSG